MFKNVVYLQYFSFIVNSIFIKQVKQIYKALSSYALLIVLKTPFQKIEPGVQHLKLIHFISLLSQL